MQNLVTQPIKYFLYARKSSEGEDRQVSSIESQIDELTKLAERNNITITEVFSEAKSAKAPGREVFRKMIDRIKKGEANGILCWKLNRLARNPIDGGEISQGRLLWAIYTTLLRIKVKKKLSMTRRGLRLSEKPSKVFPLADTLSPRLSKWLRKTGNLPIGMAAGFL